MKKMRRLIPAIAMLLVSAVMLSTATFAWFTLNDEVTASGMQIQAKADSSLVISTEPLTYNTGFPTVDFQSAVNKLTPMMYGEYESPVFDEDNNPVMTEDDPPVQVTEILAGWVVPSKQGDINTANGAMAADDVYKHLAASKNVHYVEQELYIASAGQAMTNKNITITLSAPVTASGNAYKAYAAAIYVIGEKVTGEGDDNNEALWASGGSALLDIDEEPDAIIWADEAVTTDDADGRNVVTLPGKYFIPSIVGVGEQNELTTGIKIIVRFFVDGDLESVGNDKVDVTVGYTYTDVSGGTYDKTVMYYVADTYNYETVATDAVNAVDAAAGKYYVLSGETYVPFKYIADTDETVDGDQDNLSQNNTYYVIKSVKDYKPAVPTPDMESGVSTVIPTGWFTRAARTEKQNYKYIRTDAVPTAASQLEISFTTSDAPADPAEGN